MGNEGHEFTLSSQLPAQPEVGPRPQAVNREPMPSARMPWPGARDTLRAEYLSPQHHPFAGS